MAKAKSTIAPKPTATTAAAPKRKASNEELALYALDTDVKINRARLFGCFGEPDHKETPSVSELIENEVEDNTAKAIAYAASVGRLGEFYSAISAC